MVSALASQLTGRPVRGDIAMTGEITLSGRVLPVGGIKEKVLAARRHGITELIMPRQNEKNVKEDLTEDLRKELTIHFVSEISEAVAIALQPSSQQTTTPMPVGPGRRARAGGVKVFYSPRYEVSLPGHIWPTSKYRLIADRLARRGFGAAGRPGLSSSSRPKRRGTTSRWSTPANTSRSSASSTLTPEDIATLELPWQPAARRCVPADGRRHDRRGGGGARRGAAAHLGGGLHHAFANHGEGFCPLNDVAVADSRDPARSRHSPRAVVDCDVHHGNGTSMIFERDADVFTFSIHQQLNYPFFKPRSDLDIGSGRWRGRRAVPRGAGGALPRVMASRPGVDGLSRRRGSVRGRSPRAACG